jgi:hypothetical protein
MSNEFGPYGISLEQMSFYELEPDAPAEFAEAAKGLSDPFLRGEVKTSQIPAPKGIAPHALAFAAEVPNKADTATNRGVGRIVFIHDPEQFLVWGSNFRVIAYGKSPVETDTHRDEDPANYYWQLLIRALAKHNVKYLNEAGTVTKMTSTGMGSLSTEAAASEVELRASWSPTTGEFEKHFAAWQDLIATMAGNLLEGEDVAPLARSK